MRYLQIYTVAGRQYAYFRRGALRVRLKGEVGSAEFLASYQDAQAAYAPLANGSPRDTYAKWSLGELITDWRASQEFKALRPKTRAGYEWAVGSIPPALLHEQARLITRAWIVRHRDKLAESPGKANYFVTVLKALLFWGMDRGFLNFNPAMKIKRLKSGTSFRAWTDSEIAAFTGPSAGAFALPVLLGLYTGQRRGDILKLPWSAYDGQYISLVQSKTGKALSVPAHPVLKLVLDAAAQNKSAVTICTRPDGHAWRESHFGHAFADKRAELGLPPDLHFHGLRHSAASRMAEGGASDAQVQAVTGHKSRQMVEHYTAGARQKKLATAAIAKLPKRQTKNKTV